LAADTPTIIAKMLSPPIKARFIILPPFGQEHATLFIGSITGNKIKEIRACRTLISRHVGGKSALMPAPLEPAKEVGRG
jgi:hypothetical protein